MTTLDLQRFAYSLTTEDEAYIAEQIGTAKGESATAAAAATADAIAAAELANEAPKTLAEDLEPGVSIEVSSNLTQGIDSVRELLGIPEMQQLSLGTTVKIYKTTCGTLADQVDEGETIGLTKVERKLAKTIELSMNKWRKLTTAEAIQKIGRAKAVTETDDAMTSAIQRSIKKAFLDEITGATGVTTASGKGLQGALAAAWGKIAKKFEDIDATPIYFVSSEDIADYLGSASVTMQTAFGFSYIQNFLGLGDVVVVPSLTAGYVYATAKQNLRGVYAPATSGEVASSFGLSGDSTGYIGITHAINTRNATIETLMMSAVVFYPESVEGIIKSQITQS